jgi:hypothetical protein
MVFFGHPIITVFGICGFVLIQFVDLFAFPGSFRFISTMGILSLYVGQL